MLQTKRQTFAREFLVDRNATKAAERAGYSAHPAKQQGSRLLTYVDVKREVAQLEREQRKAEKIDRQYVLNGLRKLAENAESEAVQVRSLALLGKYLRLFVEVSKSTVIHDSPALQQYSTDQLELMLDSIQQQPAIVGEVRVLD